MDRPVPRLKDNNWIITVSKLELWMEKKVNGYFEILKN